MRSPFRSRDVRRPERTRSSRALRRARHTPTSTVAPAYEGHARTSTKPMIPAIPYKRFTSSSRLTLVPNRNVIRIDVRVRGEPVATLLSMGCPAWIPSHPASAPVSVRRRPTSANAAIRSRICARSTSRSSWHVPRLQDSNAEAGRCPRGHLRFCADDVKCVRVLTVGEP